MSSEHTCTICHFNCTADLGLRSITFSSKINKLPTLIFLKSIKGGNVKNKRLCLYSQMS